LIRADAMSLRLESFMIAVAFLRRYPFISGAGA
jgi:hypothetical protein